MLTKNFATEICYTDRHAFEVVRAVTDKTIEIRQLRATRDESVELEFHVGGFAAHCSNQNQQKWLYEQDVDAPVIRIRKKKYGECYTHQGRTFVLADEPFEFYDFNF